MKNIVKYVAATLAVVLCTSCAGNEDFTDLSNEKNALLCFRIAGVEVVPSRNTGDALPTAEDQLNTITVGVFNGEIVNVIKELTAEEVVSKTVELRVSPGEEQSLVVVGNAPAGLFTGVATKSDFLSKTIDLSEDGGLRQSDNLPMSGEKTGLDLVSGETKDVTVYISRLVARVSVESISTDFANTLEFKNATFELTDIYMYNTMGTSTIATGADPVTSGLIKTAEIAGTADYLAHRGLKQVLTSEPYSTPYWFYVFANGKSNGIATDTPTKLVLKGVLDPDGAGPLAAEVQYYPIVVNKRQVGTEFEGDTSVPGLGSCTVLRNKLYKISVIIKGRGITVPDGDLETALFDLNIHVQPWTLHIDQDVVFGENNNH